MQRWPSITPTYRHSVRSTNALLTGFVYLFLTLERLDSSSWLGFLHGVKESKSPMGMSPGCLGLSINGPFSASWQPVCFKDTRQRGWNSESVANFSTGKKSEKIKRMDSSGTQRALHFLLHNCMPVILKTGYRLAEEGRRGFRLFPWVQRKDKSIVDPPGVRNIVQCQNMLGHRYENRVCL